MMLEVSKRAVLALALLLMASCSGFGVTADVGYAQFDLSGDIALEPTAGGVSLGTIKTDVQDNLGLDEEMGTPYARVEAAAGLFSFTLSGFSIDQSGNGSLNATFGDIPINTPVTTEFELNNLKGAVQLDIINLGFLRLSPGIAVDVFDLDLSVRALSGTIQEEVDAVAPVPLLFGQAEIEIGKFEAVIDVGGISIDVEDIDGTIIDVEAIARLKIGDHFELFGGLRHILLDVEGTADDQNFLSDLRMTGWMVGGGFRF